MPGNRPGRRAAAVLALVLAAGTLGGCAGAVVGTGATAGLAAYEERGIKGVASDTVRATEIRAKYVDHGGDLALRVGIEVYDGRALLTGLVASERLRADAVRLAWTVDGIADVINEIRLGDAGIADAARDGWITTKLFTRMTADDAVLAINYSIETVDGVVYLIGTAQNPAELERVINHARDVSHVRHVVSHVKIKAGGS